jgi:hypothetical protein
MNISLVIPDAQLKPGEDLSRFSALGKYVVDTQPDNIVFLGDFGEFLALSWWDRNKKLKMELRRYQEDVAVIKSALDLFFTPLWDAQEDQRIKKKRLYNPHKIWLDGNHEAREFNYILENPIMEGVVDFKKILDLKNRYGFDEVLHYTHYAEYEGVLFTHVPHYVFPTPKAVGGKYAVAKAAELVDASVIFGHLHRLEYLESFKIGKNLRQVNALSAGHFMAPGTYHDRGSAGVARIKHLPNGLFSLEFITTEELMYNYE